MSKTMNTDRAKVILLRLADDDEVHKHLRIGTVRMREAWQRAAHLPASRAVEDKKLHEKIRESATSLGRATHLLAEPEPPRRRGRKLAAIVVAGGVFALAVKRMREGQRRPAPVTT
jgi:ferric-dicitrate binding protein FerR (iron transport regulator)